MSVALFQKLLYCKYELLSKPAQSIWIEIIVYHAHQVIHFEEGNNI